MTVLIAKGNVYIARGLHHFAIRWNQLESINGFRDRHPAYLIILVTYHRSEMPFVSELHGFNAEAGTQNPVQCRRSSSTLQVAENDTPGLLAGAPGDFVRNNFSDSAEAKLAAFHIALYLLTVFWPRPFRNNNNTAEVTSRLTSLDHVRDLVEIERNFRNQNDIGAAGNASVQGNPSGVPAHYFHHHHPPVTCCRSVHAIECIHDDRYSGIEPEGRCCGFQIVVDRFGDADTVDARFLQLLRSHHRAIATNNDQRFYSKLVQYFLSSGNNLGWHNGPVPGTNFGDKMAAIGRAENRASQRHNAVGALTIQDHVVARWKESFESISETDHFPAELFRGQHHAAQNCVQPRAIAATG